ncbi:preprotein translocase subunit SecG [Bartonella sp. F02]|uniref:preprotein translocase subunit SecG n=1 Tax=Bartonella sp. F02 TaxID=2967262 RepID=UPI0022A9F52C|nr:preprotein translocase subunit SecG [Bartonella sp. F02]MCZ2328584.1 preprotein translocase subunit SecG [Bartonella sp. F02]
MQTVLLVIHFLVVIALIIVVLIQSSDGGGLGIGSGSGSSFMRARGSKNALTRLTAILATCFFIISIGLVVVGNVSNFDSDILNRIPVNSRQGSMSENASEGIPLSNGKQPLSIYEQLGGVITPSQEQNEVNDSISENPVPMPIEDPTSDRGVQ